jgi:hypothetical protein
MDHNANVTILTFLTLVCLLWSAKCQEQPSDLPSPARPCKDLQSVRWGGDFGRKGWEPCPSRD